MPNPTYHAAAFHLLNSELRKSGQAMAALRQAERRLGVSLPSSVREWYACEDAIQILADHSNKDPPIEVQDFAVVEWQSRRLLPIRHENQGVCTWALELDGSDDPHVYVRIDGTRWHPLAVAFSAYVYSCIWDYRLVFGRNALVVANNRILSPSALERLTCQFKVELQTHGWPGDTQHRFVGHNSSILIWSSDQQADWFIAATDAGALEEVLKQVWHLDAVGESLHEWTQVGAAVLERFRATA